MRYKVFCTDCSKLTLDVMAHHGLDPHNCDVHIGLDGGQDILKVALTITDRLEVEKNGRSCYSQVWDISILGELSYFNIVKLWKFSSFC